MSVCVSVCPSLREDISGTTRAIFTIFLCMLPVSVARSSSGMLTTGRIACRREGIDGCAQRGRSVIYDCVVVWCRWVGGCARAESRRRDCSCRRSRCCQPLSRVRRVRYQPGGHRRTAGAAYSTHPITQSVTYHQQSHLSCSCSQIPLRYPGRRQVRSWSQTAPKLVADLQRVGIWLAAS